MIGRVVVKDEFDNVVRHELVIGEDIFLHTAELIDLEQWRGQARRYVIESGRGRAGEYTDAEVRARAGTTAGPREVPSC